MTLINNKYRHGYFQFAPTRHVLRAQTAVPSVCVFSELKHALSSSVPDARWTGRNLKLHGTYRLEYVFKPEIQRWQEESAGRWSRSCRVYMHTRSSSWLPLLTSIECQQPTTCRIIPTNST